jgi:hypothetical protein
MDDILNVSGTIEKNGRQILLDFEAPSSAMAVLSKATSFSYPYDSKLSKPTPLGQ